MKNKQTETNSKSALCAAHHSLTSLMFASALLGLVLISGSAWAAISAIEGTVKDPKGQPVKGADIRIEAKDGSKLLKTVKTDASGHYTSDTLPVGMYRVTLIVNSAIKASINNTKTKRVYIGSAVLRCISPRNAAFNAARRVRHKGPALKS